MRKQNKIVFFSYHSWEAKRQGGFHLFAESALKNNFNVIFFTYPSPFWRLFIKYDLWGFKLIKAINKGLNYNIGQNTLINLSILSFNLPIFTRYQHFFPSALVLFFDRISLPNFKNYARKHFSGVEYFVFESTISVILFNKIKELFPDSKIIYRPSDPLICFQYGKRLIKYEYELLKNSDIVFIVNNSGYILYKNKYPNFDNEVNYKLLSNGVDYKKFNKKYPVPNKLKLPKTALYVGARPIDWQMILNASRILKDINFVIVCPVKVPLRLSLSYKRQKNLIYINGINRSLVPNWITNANLIIVPNPKNWYKSRPWGITAKYYQAIAANKPIVSYHDTNELNNLNIAVTYDLNSFVDGVLSAINLSQVDYKFDLTKKDWNFIASSFLKSIKSL